MDCNFLEFLVSNIPLIEVQPTEQHKTPMFRSPPNHKERRNSLQEFLEMIGKSPLAEGSSRRESVCSET